MSTIKIEIDVEEANLILEALGQMPFLRVYQLIARIQEQASHQIQDKAQPGETDQEQGQ